MDGKKCKFVEFLGCSHSRFVIPVYQRNYDWKPENCKQLYDDLVKVETEKRESHFFGCIVSAEHSLPPCEKDFIIIDGQQRITTVSLLLLAAHNLLAENRLETEKPSLKQTFAEYLVDKEHERDGEETPFKLRPVKNDRLAYHKLFSDPAEYFPSSNLTANYDYFYNRLQKQEISVYQLFLAICRLEIISILLEPKDNAQLIFESLNSTGLDLSEGDKIRNFILMGLPAQKQENFYEKYWNRIEVYTKYDVSAFVRDYLSVKLQIIPTERKVYANFKEYVERGGLETESLLAEMLDYARRYQTLLVGGTENKTLNACIDRLNRLSTTVTRPFFLEVLRLHDEKKLTTEQVAEIFLTTENYLFRRTMCKIPTNALNKIFLLLHRELLRYDGSEENYVEKLKYSLLSKRENSRCPNDEEFAQAFSERDVYRMPGKNQIYIFERLENFGTKEVNDVYRFCDEGVFSIEHIMPQHLTPAWQRELGPDYEQIHNEWLHRIANLTLTAYNSKYSDRSFEEKKNMENGFSKSGIRMNIGWIAKKDRWTLAELEERSQYLTETALKIWQAPTTDYQPKEKQLDVCTLDDEEELTGRLIAKFAFKTAEQPVENWAEMLEKVVRILYEENSSIVKQLTYSNDTYAALCLSKSLEKSNYRKIGDEVFLNTANSTTAKMKILKELFTLYNEKPDDLVFYLRDENEKDENAPARYELRKRYWGYALPIIRNGHGENGPYSKMNPTRDNWINGFIGISGFHLVCIALFNQARVELWFGKGDKQKNKDAFDRLYAHRAQIESKLGVALQWSRNDDGKASKVYVQLDNVSVEKEADWPQMASFQAEWVKKFNDILVPLVKDEL